MSDTPVVDLNASSESDDGIALGHYAQRAYLEYALSVVKGRALPDVCDGQKPVQRRILYSMSRMGLGFGGPNNAVGARPVKSARVVGDVLGRYHPHGDSAAYDALVRMAQDFSQRYPLIDGQGNFGSRDGDGAAAMRATSAACSAASDLAAPMAMTTSARARAAASFTSSPTHAPLPRLGSPHATSATGLTACHICAETLARPTTSAPKLGSPLPRLHRDALASVRKGVCRPPEALL